ncbi:HipA family kinase [Methyloradius palustris]|uniref:HipA-like kinase domain-containing protein n=1 Tax=Methyloradius palustris TaxID=2778876 RepID=A0A8E4BVF9_9PROT|nr:HipA family kinase [Methyloradius palustris]BCM26270.1 hypothetical protein ZMTM_25290 [Methyloradius palustris]
MPVQIVEILGRATQGMTRPFHCRGDDGYTYFVKGCGADRKSLIAEYICGKLALAFDLPVPNFEIVEVPNELIEWATPDQVKDLGCGLAFGSRKLPHVQEFNYSQLSLVDTRLRRDILVFDWWIKNADRTLTALGGNPNLLWNQETKALAVIDHNQAFDGEFNSVTFCQTHVFHADIVHVFDDLVEQINYQDRLSAAFAAFDSACDNVPHEWWWVDDGVPAAISCNEARALLERFSDNQFWRIA